jgi:hypothetical protein
MAQGRPTGEPSMDVVEELVARSKIQQLVYRYAVAVDGKDLDGLAKLFAKDVDNGRYGPGREGVKNFYDQVFRRSHCSVHFVGNHVIDFDDDEHARGVVYCLDYGHALGSEHWTDMAIAYWDTYERHGDTWLFRRRAVKRWSLPPSATVAPADGGDASPSRGGRQLPEFFPHYEEFWTRAPRPVAERG